MKDKVYCLYDRLSNRYGSVFSSPTDATAIRSAQIQFKQMNIKADEFDLCCVGEIDLTSGVMTSFEQVVRIDVPVAESSVPIANIEKQM